MAMPQGKLLSTLANKLSMSQFQKMWTVFESKGAVPTDEAELSDAWFTFAAEWKPEMWDAYAAPNQEK